MLTVPPSVRIYLAAGATDLRLRQSADGLSALVRERLGLEPMSEHLFLFLFRNRRGDRLIDPGLGPLGVLGVVQPTAFRLHLLRSEARVFVSAP